MSRKRREKFSDLRCNPNQLRSPVDYVQVECNISLNTLDLMPDLPPGQEPVGTIVFVHGLGAAAISGFYWFTYLVEHGFRVVSFDQRGHGKSSKPWSPYGATAFASDLRRLLIEKDLCDVTLVGSSTGTAIIARYMGLYGGDGRVSKVVLSSTVKPDPPQLPPATHQAFLAAISNNYQDFVLARSGTLPSSTQGQIDSAFNVIIEVPQWVYAAIIQTIDAESFREDFLKFRDCGVCTLIMVGRNDQTTPIAYAQATQALIPGSELVIVENSGHALPGIILTKYQTAEQVAFFAQTCHALPGTTTPPIL